MECQAFPTLGYKVADWIEAHCVIPDREDAGKPFRLTDEQYRILLHHYRVRPDAVFDRDARRWRGFWYYDLGSQVTKPQKWGKAPLSSAWVCAEAAPDSDVLFDGWGADGAPVGRPWPTPHLQVTACSEDQTDNIWRALIPMIQLGPLVNVFPDFGLTRINLPSGGLIEPTTAAAISRLGQRITGSAQDQTESWFATNGGHKLAENQRRGLAATGGRVFETPNAWDPVENSTAQRRFEAKSRGVFKTYEQPPAGSVRVFEERDRVLRHVYGDSLVERGGWIDLGPIHSLIEELVEYDPAQAERWFMNRTLATEGAAFDIEAVRAKVVKPRTPARGARIVIGVDGALYDDALAVVAVDVATGYMWVLGVWERPPDAGEEYEHPRHEVDAVVREAFETSGWVVWRLYADEQWIQALVDGWANRYGKRVVKWATWRPRQIAWAVRNFEQAISRRPDAKDADGIGRPHLTFGDPHGTLVRHLGNSRKKMLTALDDRERPMHTLAKPAHRSPLKIDLAMAAVLAWEALGDAIRAGAVWQGDTTDPQAPTVRDERPQWSPGEALDLTTGLVPAGDGPPMGGFS